MRFQALIVDLNASPIPATVMFNNLLFTYTNCGYLENFDSSGTGTTLPTGYSQSGTQSWRVHSGGTTSGATGPTSANSLPNYVYTETSAPATTGDTYIFDTAPEPATSAPNNTLNFQLSRIGATIGTLNVFVQDNGGMFQQIATYSGADPNQAQGATEWTLETIDLTNAGAITLGANIVVRFEYTYGGSFTGDLAIDDICLN